MSSAPKEQRSGVAWALGSVILVSSAQLLMKWGMAQLPPLPSVLAEVPEVWHVYQSAVLGIVAGVVLYVLSMACWLKVLHALPLGRAYPLLSLSYVLVAVAAAVLPGFDESLSVLKIAGIALVLLGVWLICADDYR